MELSHFSALIYSHHFRRVILVTISWSSLPFVSHSGQAFVPTTPPRLLWGHFASTLLSLMVCFPFSPYLTLGCILMQSIAPSFLVPSLPDSKTSPFPIFLPHWSVLLGLRYIFLFSPTLIVKCPAFNLWAALHQVCGFKCHPYISNLQKCTCGHRPWRLHSCVWKTSYSTSKLKSWPSPQNAFYPSIPSLLNGSLILLLGPKPWSRLDVTLPSGTHVQSIQEIL